MAMTPVKNDVEMAAPRVVSARGRLLEWSNVSLTIKANKKKQPDRVILDKVWGMAKPGETTAILGESWQVEYNQASVWRLEAKFVSRKCASIHLNDMYEYCLPM